MEISCFYFSKSIYRLLFTVKIAVLYQNCAAAIITQQGSFVSRKDLVRLFQSDHFNCCAHAPYCLGIVTHMLMLRMQWPLRADSCTNDCLYLIAPIRHNLNFVQMVDQLAHCGEEEVPARENTDRDHTRKCHARGHSHLHFFGY